MALRHAATQETGRDRCPAGACCQKAAGGPRRVWGSSAMPTGGWGLEIRIRPWVRPRPMRCIVNDAKWHCMCHRAGFTVAWDPKRASHIVPTTVAGVGAGRHVDWVSSRHQMCTTRKSCAMNAGMIKNLTKPQKDGSKSYSTRRYTWYRPSERRARKSTRLVRRNRTVSNQIFRRRK